ncbi:MAG: hypothetical protein Q9180_002501 [Flavoplaca navasiana]
MALGTMNRYFANESTPQLYIACQPIEVNSLDQATVATCAERRHEVPEAPDKEFDESDRKDREERKD